MKRFERDPQLEADYRRAINKFISNGYASLVEEENESEEGRLYLPHHGGISRIRLRAEDARYHQFLWPEETAGRILTYQMDRLTFGDCCSPFIAIYVTRKTAEDHGQGRPDAVQAIHNNLYMDDYLDSAKTEEEAIKKALAVKDILQKGDFHLEKWQSNSEKVKNACQQTTGEDKQTEYSLELTHQEIGTKILGVCWKPTPDILTFIVADVEEVSFTRRGLLSKIMGIFDPLGLASPVTIKAKIGLSELGVRGLDWDTVIPEEDQDWWKRWIQWLKQLNSIEIPRCLFKEEETIESSELHTFCDASEEAFACVVYLLNRHRDGRIKTNIVMAKTKVAPKKTISVPKLELQAALLGARLAKYAEDGLTSTIKKRYFWTDSACVKNWVRSPVAYYKPSINHRIGEIQTLTESAEWRVVTRL